MAFVSVPKDLTKVKNKIIFNLTKRQLICFGIAAAVVKFIRPPVRKYQMENMYEKKYTVVRKKKGGTKGVKKKKR